MSKPKELYRFVEGSSVWTVTSGDSSEVYNGETYIPVTIGRSEAESKNELSRANLQITVDLDNAMGRRWLKNILDEVVSLTLFSKDGADVAVIWKGRLSSVKPEEIAITLVFESIFTSLRRPGLRAKYQRSCPHALYGRGCFLNKEDWAVTDVVTNVAGATVVMPIAATYPTGYFTSGMIEAPDGTLRFIINHVGDTLTLIRALDPLTAAFAEAGYGLSYGEYFGGVKARIFPGCDRTKETCDSKFNNLLNMGGFPYIPIKNPFSGSSIV